MFHLLKIFYSFNISLCFVYLLVFFVLFYFDVLCFFFSFICLFCFCCISFFSIQVFHSAILFPFLLSLYILFSYNSASMVSVSFHLFLYLRFSCITEAHTAALVEIGYLLECARFFLSLAQLLEISVTSNTSCKTIV